MTTLESRLKGLESRSDKLVSRIDDLESRPGAGQGLNAQEVTDLIQARVNPIEKRVEGLAATNGIAGDGSGSIGLPVKICAYVTARFSQAEWIEVNYDRAIDFIFTRIPETQLYFNYGVDRPDVHQWVTLYCGE